VVFGGSVAYVPQNAWIQNATLRDNIIFGHEENSDRYVYIEVKVLEPALTMIADCKRLLRLVVFVMILMFFLKVRTRRLEKKEST